MKRNTAALVKNSLLQILFARFFLQKWQLRCIIAKDAGNFTLMFPPGWPPAQMDTNSSTITQPLPVKKDGSYMGKTGSETC